MGEWPLLSKHVQFRGVIGITKQIAVLHSRTYDTHSAALSQQAYLTPPGIFKCGGKKFFRYRQAAG